jgi:hypothetical protein
VRVEPSPYLADAILCLIAERHDFGFVAVSCIRNADGYTIRSGDKGAVGNMSICMVEIAGENYETKKFEVVGIAVNLAFDSAEAAIEYGEELINRLGVECIDA